MQKIHQTFTVHKVMPKVIDVNGNPIVAINVHIHVKSMELLINT